MGRMMSDAAQRVSSSFVGHLKSSRLTIHRYNPFPTFCPHKLNISWMAQVREHRHEEAAVSGSIRELRQSGGALRQLHLRAAGTLGSGVGAPSVPAAALRPAASSAAAEGGMGASARPPMRLSGAAALLRGSLRDSQELLMPPLVRATKSEVLLTWGAHLHEHSL